MYENEVPSKRTYLKKKNQLVEEVEFNKTSVMIEIIKLSLKTFLEYVRLKTFGKNGFQQMQVDIYLMKMVFPTLIENSESIFHPVLDEVLSSCAERCVDPTPMESSIVAKLCNPKPTKSDGTSQP